MSQDVSIAFKASDNLTNSIRQMQKSVGGLTRDVSEYRKMQSEAFDKRAEVKIDITKAKQELKELEKAVKNNVEGSEKAFKEKQKSVEQLNEEYRRLGLAAKEASKAELSLQKDIHQGKNYAKTMEQKAPSIGSMENTRSIEGIRGLAKAGLGAMIGGAISSNLNQSIASAFGSQAGNSVGNVVGGVATGAAMGSIAGPVGAAVGAAVGGLTGAINALTQKQQNKDDLFKEEVQNKYDRVKQEQKNSLDNGIVLAGKREQDMISYGTLLKSKENANKFLNDVQTFSAKTPFEMNDLLDTSKVMLSYKYKQDEILPMMTKIGDTGSALGIDSEGQKDVATALGRMKSSGKTSLEYINQLTERAIPAIDYLSDALGKSNEEVYEMISKGTIDGAKASKIIVDAMGKEFEGNMAKQSGTYEGLLSSLSDTWAQIDQAMGEGYNEERKKGMEEEIKQLDSGLAEQIQEANKQIGAFYADIENKKQQAILDAYNSVMNDPKNQDYDEYQKAKATNDQAKMGEIMARAKVTAETEWKKTEGYKLQQESDLALVEGIQKDEALNGAYVDYGIRMGEQFSKGFAGAVESILKSNMLSEKDEKKLVKDKGSFWQKADVVMDDYNALKNKLYNDTPVKPPKLPKLPELPSIQFLKPFATGIDRVPYNDMPALLHEGERVKTKVEADKEDRGMGGVNIAKLADSIVVREEADIDRIIEGLYSKLKKHAINTGGAC